MHKAHRNMKTRAIKRFVFILSTSAKLCLCGFNKNLSNRGELRARDQKFNCRRTRLLRTQKFFEPALERMRKEKPITFATHGNTSNIGVALFVKHVFTGFNYAKCFPVLFGLHACAVGPNGISAGNGCIESWRVEEKRWKAFCHRFNSPVNLLSAGFVFGEDKYGVTSYY